MTHWAPIYKERRCTAEEAAQAVKSGDRIFLTGNCSTPQVFLEAFVKHAYDPAPPTAQDRLVGRSVVAEQELTPTGYVRMNGELWRAQLEDASAPVGKGQRARVVAVRGLTLLVSAEGAAER